MLEHDNFGITFNRRGGEISAPANFRGAVTVLTMSSSFSHLIKFRTVPRPQELFTVKENFRNGHCSSQDTCSTSRATLFSEMQEMRQQTDKDHKIITIYTEYNENWTTCLGSSFGRRVLEYAAVLDVLVNLGDYRDCIWAWKAPETFVLKRLLVIISPGTDIGFLAAYSTYTDA